MSPKQPPPIRIAAALLTDAAGRLLLVRKRGTLAFMQPGGKIEPQEDPVAALVRELGEELGLAVPASALRPVGRFTAPAANEPGFTVEAELFAITTTARPVPAAEIEEIRWVEPAMAEDLPLAPLTRHHVLPLHRPAVGRPAARAPEH